MNNEKQLPPELVEKMRIAYNNPKDHKECAQIAVDYAESWEDTCFIYVERVKNVENVNVQIRKQRDELIEALRELTESVYKFSSDTRNIHLCLDMVNNHKKSKSILFSFSQLNNPAVKAQQLLKKHEDGKE